MCYHYKFVSTKYKENNSRKNKIISWKAVTTYFIQIQTCVLCLCMHVSLCLSISMQMNFFKNDLKIIKIHKHCLHWTSKMRGRCALHKSGVRQVASMRCFQTLGSSMQIDSLPMSQCLLHTYITGPRWMVENFFIFTSKNIESRVPRAGDSRNANVNMHK